MRCESCGQEFETLHWSPDGRKRLCDECFYKEFDYCISCDGPFPKNQLREFEGQLYCEYCFNEVVKERRRER